jgi:CRISPR/Cas system CSM-associated protein Csm3 (group 7 of RAMP superfamily)
MFRRQVNELVITVNIQGQGESALLVKDGRYSREVKRAIADTNADLKNHLPDMLFMCTDPLSVIMAVLNTEDTAAGLRRLHYYLPGSSVRGAWRSHLEKVLRSLDPQPKVCDPLVAKEGEQPELPSLSSCSDFLANDKDEPRPFPYHDSCPVCRLFGNAATGGRLVFSDGKFLSGTPDLIDGISISRFTGSVSNKYRIMAIRNPRFEMTLRLRNFELWHAGLLAHLFNDLGQGRVSLGSGRNKGMGAVTAHATRIDVTEFGFSGTHWNGTLRGLAEQCTPEEIGSYGFISGIAPPAIETTALNSPPWRHSRSITNVAEFWSALKPCFNEDVWNKLQPLSARRAAVGQA